MFTQTIVYTVSMLVILFLVYELPVAAIEFNPDLLCTYIANNTKINDPSACNKYITCVNQNPISSTCDGDLFYDRNKRSCVKPNMVKCYSSNPCAVTSGADGFVADPYSCNSYYYCRNGNGLRGNCSHGMNFNPETKKCVKNFSCELKMVPENYCNIVPDGVFIKMANSCTAYQTCWRGELLNGTCPDSFYFNALIGECDYPSNVGCEQATTLAPEIPTGIKCIQHGVFISDGISCNGYYYCKGNLDGSIGLIHNECPVGRFFDPSDSGACVVRTNISCVHNRCVTLGHHNIQLANINGDGCTGFSICQDGKIIGRSVCPSGEYFDEMIQLCTTKMVSYPACALKTKSSVSLDRLAKTVNELGKAKVFTTIT